MLEVRDLRVRYGAIAAVDGVDLDVGAGEATALLGANGAGKTSTLHAISRLVAASGRIVFDGRDLAGSKPEDVARLGLLHVPEGRHVFVKLTVHENILVGLTPRSGRTAAFGVDDVYDLFPLLREIRSRAGWALSGGEQQMVAIARALVGAPRMLLLDEPFLGLAPAVARVVVQALAQVRQEVPMLVVEQNTTRALQLCARAYVLASGRVVLEGTAAELSDRQAMLDSYLGQRDVRQDT